MGQKSDIEWCDATWEATLGCEHASPGCKGCYAERLIAVRLGRNPATPRYHGLARVTAGGEPRWERDEDGNAIVRMQPDHLELPLHWRKPRRVFVCSRSDLFHPAVPFEYIAAVFQVMAATPQHTYLVLTKRAERMAEFFSWLDPDPARMLPRLLKICAGQPWPLQNVHLGVSVEDQRYADDRIPWLLQCPAEVRWISAEPLLGPIAMMAFLKTPHRDECLRVLGKRDDTPGLDWVVLGGESGPHARTCNLQWFRDIIEECRGSGTKVFVKQVGENAFDEHPATMMAFDPITAKLYGVEVGVSTPAMRRVEYKGYKASKARPLWPRDIDVQEYPQPVTEER